MSTSSLHLPRPDRAWFLRPDGRDGSSGIHGIGHTRRVMLHADEIAQELRIAALERESVVLAALWHDIGRTNDGADYYHGAKSAGKVVGLGLHAGIERRVLELALHAITHHSGDEKCGEKASRYLPDPDAALRVFRVLKDANALDRVRLDNLDVSYLRFPSSRHRVERAWELLKTMP